MNQQRLRLLGDSSAAINNLEGFEISGGSTEFGPICIQLRFFNSKKSSIGGLNSLLS